MPTLRVTIIRRATIVFFVAALAAGCPSPERPGTPERLGAEAEAITKIVQAPDNAPPVRPAK